MTSDLFETLKTKTKSDHSDLEKILIQKLKAVSDEKDYLKILETFHSFYSPLEDSIYNYIDKDTVADFTERKKTECLTKDIHSLNGNTDLNPVEVPDINNVSRAIGSLYVLEGSTLGGQVISGMIGRALPSVKAFNFFNPYGENTMPMWFRFKESIIKNESRLDAEEIVYGAQQTFSQLKKHFENNFQ